MLEFKKSKISILIHCTLDDSQQDNNNEEEEWNVEKDSVSFQWITVRGLKLVSNTSACSNTFIEMEHEALKHQ